MTDNIISPMVRTPALDHAATVQLAHEIRPGTPLLSIPCHPTPLPIGNCYWNAHAMVEGYGGEIQHGWLFFVWPQRYVEAMHHAVWRQPDGTLVDVTQKYRHDPSREQSTFLPDDTIDIDLERLPNIQSRYMLSANRPEIKAFHDAYLAKHEAASRYAKSMYAAGYRCQRQFDMARRILPRPLQIDTRFAGNIKADVDLMNAKNALLADAIKRLKKPMGASSKLRQR